MDKVACEPADNAEDYGLTAPAEMQALAVAASRVAGSEFVGVDVIEHLPTGRLYLLEANFPCYFPQAEEFGLADVSGAMLDHLIAKRAASQFVEPNPSAAQDHSPRCSPDRFSAKRSTLAA